MHERYDDDDDDDDDDEDEDSMTIVCRKFRLSRSFGNRFVSQVQSGENPAMEVPILQSGDEDDGNDSIEF